MDKHKTTLGLNQSLPRTLARQLWLRRDGSKRVCTSPLPAALPELGWRGFGLLSSGTGGCVYAYVVDMVGWSQLLSSMCWK